MIIVLKSGTPEVEAARITLEMSSTWNVEVEKIAGQNNTVLGMVGETATLDPRRVQNMSAYIESVLRISKPFKRVSREYRNGESSTVSVSTPAGMVHFGEEHPTVVMAGPCSVESEAMVVEIARRVKAAGAQFLRGGAYKPRTSPYSFQGHGESALEMLTAARAATGLGIVTEVMDTADLAHISDVADIVQVGARNMQNFALLKKVGAQPKPVLLKRGYAATIDDWLMAAEYVMAAGNPNVILCERGIRTFDSKYTRNTLDLSAIPVLRSLTHLPNTIDPSHGTGVSQFVPTMAKAAVCAGADSLMIEVHTNPAAALSDGPQSLTPDQFDVLMSELAVISELTSRSRQPALALS